MKKYKINKILTINLSIILTVFLAFVYIYQVNVTTVNASNADVMKKESLKLRTEVSKLEFDYIEKTRKITLNDALNFSLISSESNQEKVFVKRDINKLSLNER